VDPTIPYTAVHASRAKLTRAEPVSALYEQGKVHHVGVFGPLEDQLTSYDGSRTGASPDRLDALCWAVWELMLGEPPGRFIRGEALLSPDPAGQTAPVEMPAKCEHVLAVAAITESEPDALGTVFFCVQAGKGEESPRVVVLDWDIVPLEQGTLDSYFPAVAARLDELVELTDSESRHASILVDPTGLSAMLVEQGRLRRFSVMPIVDEQLIAKDLVSRVIEVGSYLAAGGIKLARPAHDKVSTFKGVHRNHLLGELSAFTLGEKKVGPLLAAFATGAIETLGKNFRINVWRRLAGAASLEPGPLSTLWAAAPPPELIPALVVGPPQEALCGQPPPIPAGVRVMSAKELEALKQKLRGALR